MKNTTRRKESNFTLVNFFSLLVFWTVGMGFLDDWGMLKISRENGSLSVLVVVGVWGWASWHLCLGFGWVVDKIKDKKKDK